MTAVDHAELLSDLGFWEMEAGRLSEGRKLASEYSEVEWGHLKRALSQSIDALRTQAPDSWRPIETAPKDGETVLIFTPRTFPHVTAASYRSDCAAEHWASVGHRWHFPGDVTHWMPLPAAPPLRPQTAESGK